MSRALRKQMFSVLNLLEKANRTLKVNLTAKHVNEEGTQQLLSECQEMAIAMGSELETIYGEGTETVHELEDYCETLYHMTLVLHDPEKRRVMLHTLAGQIRQARKLLGEQIPDRQEVVFLPYKASMWDSLESVWRAAEEDEDCDVYVVPIPYYDRDPDGTFSQYHYEGDEMPDDVPVTHYENYDIQKRLPDKVFIHNPYDQYNYVTSVDPRFYSIELKKCTETLVYIPYFVLGEVGPEDEKGVEGMAHFCTAPGVLNADKVIVQSENMRQVYIKVLTKACGEQTRKHWEKTILGTGSPKFEKVQSTKKEGLRIPEEWLEMIRKPDGKWKKIILYNTSVSALLEHQEKMLEKMKFVFQVFQENREEIALLWRPHPLIGATIRSMRPQLWTEYQRLVRKYQAEGWGIYDASPELNRAIALCDAYYGDWSSLVQLCQKAGKPIMIQDVEIL
nr:hypothetical protein [uncultured Schaedlerella sp.]